MLSPKRTKYRKMQRGRLKGKACRNNKLNHGEYGIQALEPVWLTSRQIEAVRRTISRYTKRTGKLWIKVFYILVVGERSSVGRRLTVRTAGRTRSDHADISSVELE